MKRDGCISCRMNKKRDSTRRGTTVKQWEIAVIPGDGIGKEVVPAALDVLKTIADVHGGSAKKGSAPSCCKRSRTSPLTASKSRILAARRRRRHWRKKFAGVYMSKLDRFKGKQHRLQFPFVQVYLLSDELNRKDDAYCSKNGLASNS